jgi:alkanesulfonate monooxygenase SsuD/methylene tetrahydromethanopterin reductase-like flavin-dependent oxidoreductase (luciferase family)
VPDDPDPSVEVLRLLWDGGEQTHRGTHYTVEHARIYTLPDEPPEVYVAATAPRAAELAGRIGDGLVSTAPEEELVQTFEEAGGDGKPKIGMTHCAYEAGFTHVYVHQIGDNQDEFVEFAARELMPSLKPEAAAGRA